MSAATRGRAFAGFSLTAFVAAFLLFESELVLGKLILPWFGGSPAAWTTCLVVFQVLVLAGYAYADTLAAYFWGHRSLHFVVLGASLLVLIAHGVAWPSPITPGAAWKPLDPAHPELHVVAILLTVLGFPVFVLSASTPLLAHDLARIDAGAAYRLYAYSNAGSLTGLLAYPLVVEPHLSLRFQCWALSFGYLLFAIGLCAALVSHGVGPQAATAPPRPPIRASPRRYAEWLALSSCASAALVAVTHVICQDIAPMSWLWAVPLSLYLTTFVICFGRPRRVHRGAGHMLLALSVMIAFVARCMRLPVIQLPAYLIALLAICMTCHSELARSAPTEARPTSFFLLLAAGGALGGVFVGALAPLVFPDFWEFELVLFASGAIVVVSASGQRDSWWYSGRGITGAVLFGAAFAIPWAAARLDVWLGPTLRELNYFVALALAAAAAAALTLVIQPFLRHTVRFRGIQLSAVALLFAYGYEFIAFEHWRGLNLVTRTRNFYGLVSVQEDRRMMLLIHGATFQGAQYRAASLAGVPTLYYGHDSGIGLLLENHPKRQAGIGLRLGVVGLGAGTLAAYGRFGDYMRFYEINPAIVRLSQHRNAPFTFLSRCLARFDVVLGDARLSLEAELARGARQNFDILVLDAFNGDEIPTHLLTEEAVQIYLEHLAPDGVLAFHTTNATLDLKPLVESLGAHFSLKALPLIGRDRETHGTSEWVLLSRNARLLELSALSRLAQAPTANVSVPIWTDDYGSVWPLIVAALRARI